MAFSRVGNKIDLLLPHRHTESPSRDRGTALESLIRLSECENLCIIEFIEQRHNYQNLQSLDAMSCSPTRFYWFSAKGLSATSEHPKPSI